MMLTPEQIISNIKSLLEHADRMERGIGLVVTQSQHNAIFNKPQPFELAKLEQWKPSKHRKH